MKLLDRILLWRARRRHAAHKVWLRQNKIVTLPSCDWRAFSANYIRSLRK